MKILHAVEFYHPSVGGAQEVVRQLSEGLVGRGHEVTVATTRVDGRVDATRNGVRIVEFAASGNSVRGMQGEIEQYRDFIRGSDADVVLFYAAQQWTTDAALDLAGSIPAACVLAPCGFSGLLQPAYASYFDRLPEALRRFDALVVHSSTYRDAAFLERAGIGQVAVIANGASEAEFDPPATGFRSAFGIDEDAPLVVTVGSHTGMKGHEEAIAAARRMRTQDVTLVVLGNESPGGCLRSCRVRSRLTRWTTRGRKRVIVADVPRRLVVAGIAEADLLLLTSRIECSPLVLFEAMAAGTPFVTSEVGNARELADTWMAGVTVSTRFDRLGYASVRSSEVARTLDALLGDPRTRQRMGAAGREAWAQAFTWSRICEEYESVYRIAVERRAGR